jgi:hypothetical protein
VIGRAVWSAAFGARLRTLLFALVVGLWPAMSVHADELADLEAARAFYDAQRYADATERLERLLAGDAPERLNRAIALEARKYLAAAYLFTERGADAERQFALLLAIDAEYQLDPTLFPAEIRAVFASVRARLVREERERADRVERAETERRAAEAARLLAESARLAALRDLATQETVVETHTRWIAAIPFGIGQFQNGHAALGTVLAVSEGLLAGASITLKILHDTLPTPSTFALLAPADQAAASNLELGYRTANLVTMGVLVALMIVGVVDAQLRFVPSISRTRPRTLPPELRSEASAVSLEPFAGGLRLRF